MLNIQRLISKIKEHDQQAYVDLLQKFNPLIYSWLKKTTELYQKNKEDYLSLAKIILFESALNYDEKRNVPFASYYKINLYHAYARIKRKMPKETNLPEQEQEHKLPDQAENIEEKILLETYLKKLPSKQREIIEKILQGKDEEVIAKELRLSKKTVLNLKYEAIKNLKKMNQDI